jgi:FixJ family two-component response regulator
MMITATSTQWNEPGPAAVVFVIDDDVSVRESLELLMMSAGWRVELFATAEAFLAFERPVVPSCLILDINLPELSGIDLQARMAAGAVATTLPIIFITGRSDVRTTVRAMKAGAFEFLTKPFDHDTLLSAVDDALRRSSAAIFEAVEIETIRCRYESLSCREREVMARVIRGLLNKQIAADLGISEITVKAHRGRVMRKMQADSLADLVVIAARLDGVDTPDRISRPGRLHLPVG